MFSSPKFYKQNWASSSPNAQTSHKKEKLNTLDEWVKNQNQLLTLASE